MTEKKSMLDGEKQYHIQLKEGDIADFVILPGDPGRVDFIAEHFDDAKEIAFNREYKTVTGTYKGRPVSVTSTGIGCPSAAIAIEELANIGAKTLVRLGTSGAMQDHTRIGDLVIANGAVRQEGTSLQYMVSALESAAIESESKYHIGVVQSKDSFYGQHDPNSMPVSYDLNQKWDAWVKGGVLCSEMEVSTLFVVGSYRRVRTGALLVIYGDQKRQEALSKESYLESVNKATSIILESSLKI
jgi:uridine phosphorylase